MARFEPGSLTKFGYIHLSHEEVEAVCDSSNPAAVLAELVPQAGHFLAAGIKISAWQLRRVDRKHGSRGVRIQVAGFDVTMSVVAGLVTGLGVLPPE
jgi:hypothetical protein